MQGVFELAFFLGVYFSAACSTFVRLALFRSEDKLHFKGAPLGKQAPISSCKASEDRAVDNTGNQRCYSSTMPHLQELFSATKAI